MSFQWNECCCLFFFKGQGYTATVYSNEIQGVVARPFDPIKTMVDYVVIARKIYASCIFLHKHNIFFAILYQNFCALYIFKVVGQHAV
jgi:hypothetical protein